jgi:hypothetical protein
VGKVVGDGPVEHGAVHTDLGAGNERDLEGHGVVKEAEKVRDGSRKCREGQGISRYAFAVALWKGLRHCLRPFA